MATNRTKLPFKCSDCSFSTSTEGGLGVHRAKIHKSLDSSIKSVSVVRNYPEGKKFKCCICNSIISSFPNFKRHFINIHPDILLVATGHCSICQVDFENAMAVSVHCQRAHGISKKKPCKHVSPSLSPILSQIVSDSISNNITSNTRSLHTSRRSRKRRSSPERPPVYSSPPPTQDDVPVVTQILAQQHPAPDHHTPLPHDTSFCPLANLLGDDNPEPTDTPTSHPETSPSIPQLPDSHPSTPHTEDIPATISSSFTPTYSLPTSVFDDRFQPVAPPSTRRRRPVASDYFMSPTPRPQPSRSSSPGVESPPLHVTGITVPPEYPILPCNPDHCQSTGDNLMEMIHQNLLPVLEESTVEPDSQVHVHSNTYPLPSLESAPNHLQVHPTVIPDQPVILPDDVPYSTKPNS